MTIKSKLLHVINPTDWVFIPPVLEPLCLLCKTIPTRVGYDSWLNPVREDTCDVCRCEQWELAAKRTRGAIVSKSVDDAWEKNR